VQYAKRMVGRRVYGGTSTYIPLKVNMAGVIPVIFASSLLSLPMLSGAVQPALRRHQPRLGRLDQRPPRALATTRTTCCSTPP
jgi:preprotein translocase subunit SecY